MIGRNDLCPCGSGKKYKKCCLQKNQQIEFTKNRVLYAKGLYENVENKIYKYSKELSFNDRAKCADKFYVSKEYNSKIDKLYNEYFFNDYRDNNNKTIIEKFADKNKLTLNKKQKSILSSILKSKISIFKIEDIGKTKIIMRDYFNDNKISVQDIETCKNLNVGDNIICRLVNIQFINILPYGYIKVSSQNIKVILKNIKKLYELNIKDFKNMERFLTHNSDIIYKFAQQIILNDESYVIDELEESETKQKVKSNENTKSYTNICDILKNNIEEPYLQKGLDLWKKFIQANKSIKGNENGWAAAVEYYIKKDAGETITQVQISEKYKVSASTVGKRYKELRIS